MLHKTKSSEDFTYSKNLTIEASSRDINLYIIKSDYIERETHIRPHEVDIFNSLIWSLLIVVHKENHKKKTYMRVQGKCTF